MSPCEHGPREQYGHVAAFVRNASAAQQVTLWSRVSEAMGTTLRKRSGRCGSWDPKPFGIRWSWDPKPFGIRWSWDPMELGSEAVWDSMESVAVGIRSHLDPKPLRSEAIACSHAFAHTRTSSAPHPHLTRTSPALHPHLTCTCVLQPYSHLCTHMHVHWHMSMACTRVSTCTCTNACPHICTCSHTHAILLPGPCTRPTWLSTEGSGVPWLHVRLDSRPKYYHHAAYAEPPQI